MPSTEQVKIDVPRQLAERLDKLAQGSGQKPSSLAVLALETWLADEEQKRASIRVGLREIRAGKSIPHEDVRAWLASWGTEDELPPPTCE